MKGEIIKTTHSVLVFIIHRGMPAISIIVPVYCAEKYLSNCIESVLAQSFEDFELILVDDGSPDSSGELCDKYAKEDRRIRVVHKENGGVSSARNAGLNVARGEYVTFLDSDDWFDKNFLKLAIKEVLQDDLDIYLAGAVFWQGTVKQYLVVIDERIDCCCSKIKEEEFSELLRKSYISSCWGGVFRRDTIGEKRFQVGCTFGEDLKFVFSLLDGNGKMLAVPEGYYYYRNTPGSATKHFSIKKIFDVLDTYCFLLKFAKDKKMPEFVAMVEDRWLKDYIYIQERILESDESTLLQYQKLKALLRDQQLRSVIIRTCDPYYKRIAKKTGWFMFKYGLHRFVSKMLHTKR